MFKVSRGINEDVIKFNYDKVLLQAIGEIKNIKTTQTFNIIIYINERITPAIRV